MNNGWELPAAVVSSAPFELPAPVDGDQGWLCVGVAASAAVPSDSNGKQLKEPTRLSERNQKQQRRENKADRKGD